MQHGAVVPLPTLPARNRQHRLKANVRDLQFSLILGLFFLLLLLFFLQSNSAECCFCSIHPLDYSAAPERWFICKPSLALGSRGVLVCGLCCGTEGFVTRWWMFCFVVLCGCAVVQVMAVLGFGTSELSFYLSPLLPGRDSANSIS